MADLVTLPGVGRKTANVVRSVALRAAGPARRHPRDPPGRPARPDHRDRPGAHRGGASAPWCPGASGGASACGSSCTAAGSASPAGPAATMCAGRLLPVGPRLPHAGRPARCSPRRRSGCQRGSRRPGRRRAAGPARRSSRRQGPFLLEEVGWPSAVPFGRAGRGVVGELGRQALTSQLSSATSGSAGAQTRRGCSWDGYHRWPPCRPILTRLDLRRPPATCAPCCRPPRCRPGGAGRRRAGRSWPRCAAGGDDAVRDADRALRRGADRRPRRAPDGASTPPSRRSRPTCARALEVAADNVEAFHRAELHARRRPPARRV